MARGCPPLGAAAAGAVPPGAGAGTGAVRPTVALGGTVTAKDSRAVRVGALDACVGAAVATGARVRIGTTSSGSRLGTRGIESDTVRPRVGTAVPARDGADRGATRSRAPVSGTGTELAGGRSAISGTG